MPPHYTSIIKLRPEFTERYQALHRNTFPGVLKRIALCNILNYSIFLHENILFSYYDYCGNNYENDMAAMADDITRDWWSLTDPMQEPLPDRKGGEWWASCDDLYYFNASAEDVAKHEACGMRHEVPGSMLNAQCTTHKTQCMRRRAFRCEVDCDVDFLKNIFREKFPVHQESCTRLLISYRNHNLFVYAEFSDETSVENEKNIIDLIRNVLLKSALKADFEEMKEVFYTDMEKENNPKKVFVSGCFDMLHSGHVAFIQEAASFGNLYVCIGSDDTIHQLKGRYPVNNQDERRYMIRSLKYVADCRINRGSGILDFLAELDEIQPDIFVVNEDGNTPQKAQLCKEKDIEYKVLKRIPHGDLPRRSTTDLRKECTIPYRIDIAGGWLDQPWVSELYPGPVITISIEPTLEFNHRSGMATSTRNKAIELWKTDIPQGNREQLAKVLFTFDNPPGTEHVSGSQDSIGIVMPYLNKLNYRAGYWPESIETTISEEIMQWLEGALYLIPLGPRKNDYRVLDNTNLSADGAKRLADAAEGCWKAIHEMDMDAFGKYFTQSFEAQISMFPNMADDEIFSIIEQYRDKAKGWKLSGAGGGGYLIVISDKPIDGAVKIKIRKNVN